MRFEPLDLELPRDLGQLARLRATLGDWLGRAGVTNQDREEIVLAAHEAVANGIEHSDGDGELRVRGEVDDQAVTVTVTSPGPWREPERRLGRGHGLVIIRGLTDVDIAATATSSHVRMRRLLNTHRRRVPEIADAVRDPAR